MTLLTFKLREIQDQGSCPNLPLYLQYSHLLPRSEEWLPLTTVGFLSFGLEASRHCTSLSALRNDEETICPEPKEVKPKAGTEHHSAGNQGEQRNQQGERDEHTLNSASSIVLPSAMHFPDLKCVRGAEVEIAPPKLRVEIITCDVLAETNLSAQMCHG